MKISSAFMFGHQGYFSISFSNKNDSIVKYLKYNTSREIRAIASESNNFHKMPSAFYEIFVWSVWPSSRQATCKKMKKCRPISNRYPSVYVSSSRKSLGRFWRRLFWKLSGISRRERKSFTNFFRCFGMFPSEGAKARWVFSKIFSEFFEYIQWSRILCRCFYLINYV